MFHGGGRLSAKITTPTGESELWFSICDPYEKYLFHERSDAFVFGLLNLAQRRGYDIVCEAPMSAELHYRLTSILIPALSKHGRSMHRTQIHAELTDSPLENAGGVGTGCSCGVDSLHAIMHHLRHPMKSLRLTHLVVNNAGAFQKGMGQYERSVKVASRIAQDEGVSLVITDSNISDFYSEGFELYHTYANMFCVLALRKLWRTFFYGSSGHDYSHFSVVDNDVDSADKYDLMSLFCVSTGGLNVYDEGGAFSRFEKTRAIYDFELARKCLNVCVCDTGSNCSKCDKCRRTLLNLDALGGVEPFGDVFDINVYRKNKVRYLGWALWKRWNGYGDMTNDALDILVPSCRVSALFWALVYFARWGRSEGVR